MLIQTIRAAVLIGLALVTLGLSQPGYADDRVAHPAAAFELQDLQGQPLNLEVEPGRLTVVCFLGTECPLAKLYAGRLQTPVSYTHLTLPTILLV